MNRELKRVSVVVLFMFVALFVSTSVLQVGVTDTLNADARNSRTRSDAYDVQRGAILVAGQPIAQSVASSDEYKFQRTYANGPLYSAVTGFYPINGAATGIEGAENDQLSGTSNTSFLDRLNNILTGKSPQGNSVNLTINPVAQQAAYDALGDLKGAVAVIEPKTGRILALVSKPSYDPNVLAGHDTKKVEASYEELLKASGDPLVNKPLTDLNPPGSTFKLVVASAALASGDYTKDSQLPNPASFTLPQSNTVVRNDTFTTCGPGATVSIETALQLSCNIPMAELGIKLKSSAIKKQAESFGFNTSFQVPMKTSKSAYPGYPADPAKTGMSAFGQADDTATALQMAMVSAGIANSGKVMQPNLIESVQTPSLTEVPGTQFTPKQFSQAISSDVAGTMSSMMVNNVENGVAGNARIDGVGVGGKTGTAQNDDNPYSLWFTGFAPANNPELAVAVVVENGGGLGQTSNGNALAAPVARKVLEAVLNK